MSYLRRMARVALDAVAELETIASEAVSELATVTKEVSEAVEGHQKKEK